ncbi:MAG: putative membrane protein [Flavobacteriaceae bacterium]|jgi:putative membrane protein
MIRGRRTFNDNIWLVLKGLAMGAANKVPGVSGGVVAFVGGFYEEFIYSLQKINSKAFVLLYKRGFKRFYQYINGKFLGRLILGMIISYFSVSKVLDYLIEHFELYVWSGFFGLIIGSIYYLAKDFGAWRKKNIVYLLCGIIAGLSISFLEPAKENDHLIFVFLCGIIGVSGMTLPGLSGSFILILLGNYVLLLVDSVNALFDTLTEMIQGDFSFLQNSLRIRLLKVLAAFSIGSLAGLVTLSHVLGYLLKHFKKITYAVIIGFIIGSLGVVWPWKIKQYDLDAAGNIKFDANGREVISYYKRFFPTEFSHETILAIMFTIVGILIVLSLDWFKKD